MNGKQLKNSILQWAIQGKLVPQDPNDEPASVLLEKIREEKARLVKEGKIKKDKNESVIYRGDDNSHYEKFADGTIKCIDEEIPFDLPKGWEWSRWGNLSESIQYGFNAPALAKGSIKMVRISDIQNNRILWDSVPYCEINKSEIDNYLLHKNDILFARTGGTVGKSYLVADEPEQAIYAGYLIRTRYSNMLSPQYLKYFMESGLYWAQLKDGTIATAQPNCNGKTLSKMLLPLPPVREQYRIVEKLNNVLEIVRGYEKSQDSLDKLNLELPERIKKSILQEAIQGRLVPQNPEDEPASKLLERIREEKQKMVAEGRLKKSELNDSVIFRGEDNKYYERIGNDTMCVDEDIPFELPQGWEWTRVCLVANMFTGNSISETEKKSKFTSVEGMDYIGTKDVTFNNTIKYNNGVNIPQKYIDSFKIAPANSILLCIEGGSAGKKIAVTNQDVCFGNKLCCFTPFHSILTKYLFFYIQSATFHEAFTHNKTGIIGGVSVNALKKMLVAIPPLNEIVRICEKTDSLLTSIMRK